MIKELVILSLDVSPMIGMWCNVGAPEHLQLLSTFSIDFIIVTKQQKMRLFVLLSVISALELDELDIDAEFTMSDIQEPISESYFSKGQNF